MAWCPDAPLRHGDCPCASLVRRPCCRGLAVVLRPAVDVVLRQLLQSRAAVTRHATRRWPLPDASSGPVSGRAAARLAGRVWREVPVLIAGAWDPATSPATSVQTIHDACGGMVRLWGLLRLAL